MCGLPGAGMAQRPAVPPARAGGLLWANTHGMRVREGWARANRAGVGKPSAARMAKARFPTSERKAGCLKRVSGEMVRAHPEPAEW